MKFEYAILELIGDASNTKVFPLFFILKNTVTLFTEKFDNETCLLNAVGNQGWELFKTEGRIYYLKRLKTN